MTSDRLFELLLAQTWQVGVLAVAVWGIVRISVRHCRCGDVARGILLTMIPQRSIRAINAESKATISAVPEFPIDGDDLHVFETREQIAIVKNGLEELRRYGFDSVQLQLKLITVSAEQLDALELMWEKASEPASEVMARLDAMRMTPEMLAGQLPAAPATFQPVQTASAAGETPQSAPAKIVQRISSETTVEEFETQVREQMESNEPLAGYIRSDLGIAGQLVFRGLSSPVTTHCAVIDTEKVAAISKLIESGEKEAVLITPSITYGNGACFQISSGSPWLLRARTRFWSFSLLAKSFQQEQSKTNVDKPLSPTCDGLHQP